MGIVRTQIGRGLGALLLGMLLLASSIGCAKPSGGSIGLPPVPTPEQSRQMAFVDEVRDPITGALIFPELREWHGQVADYFCAAGNPLDALHGFHKGRYNF